MLYKVLSQAENGYVTYETTQKGITFEFSTHKGNDVDTEILSITPGLDYYYINFNGCRSHFANDIKVKGVKDTLKALGEAGFIPMETVETLREATEALKELRAAKAAYRAKMEALGATQEEDGSYEDYEVWYSLTEKGIAGSWSLS